MTVITEDVIEQIKALGERLLGYRQPSIKAKAEKIVDTMLAELKELRIPATPEAVRQWLIQHDSIASDEMIDYAFSLVSIGSKTPLPPLSNRGTDEEPEQYIDYEKEIDDLADLMRASGLIPSDKDYAAIKKQAVAFMQQGGRDARQAIRDAIEKLPVTENIPTVRDANGEILKVGYIVDVKATVHGKRIWATGKLIKIGRTPAGETFLRFEFTGEDLGHADPIVYLDVRGTQLAKDPDMLKIRDRDIDEGIAQAGIPLYENQARRILSREAIVILVEALLCFVHAKNRNMDWHLVKTDLKQYNPDTEPVMRERDLATAKIQWEALKPYLSPEHAAAVSAAIKRLANDPAAMKAMLTDLDLSIRHNQLMAFMQQRLDTY